MSTLRRPRDRLNRRRLAGLAAALLLTLGAVTALAVPPGNSATFSTGLVSGSFPAGLIRGQGGDLWFVDLTFGAPELTYIGRVSSQGRIRLFSAHLPAKTLVGALAEGADGDLWFTEANFVGAQAIGRMTPSGQVTRFTRGFGKLGFFQGLAPGPGGNLWFTVQSYNKAPAAIGRMTPAGTVTVFRTPADSLPLRITAGPDGNMWFTDAGPGSHAAIGRITNAGVITEFRMGLQGHSPPRDITAGPDGDIWFSNGAPISLPPPSGAIGRVTPSGTITEFTAGLPSGSDPANIAAGPDGSVWFTEDRCQGGPSSQHFGNDCAVGRVTSTGAITEFNPGIGKQLLPLSIISGADGDLWFTAAGLGSGGRPTGAEIGRFPATER